MIKYFCDKCGKELQIQDRYNIFISAMPNLENRQDLKPTVRDATLCKKDAQYLMSLICDKTWETLNKRDGLED